jgi:hypothetical protein
MKRRCLHVISCLVVLAASSCPGDPPKPVGAAGATAGLPEASAQGTAPPLPGAIEFHGEDLAVALQALARQANLNLVSSDQVVASGGTVTLHLEGHTPREALDIVAVSKGLLIDEVDGVLYVKEAIERALEPFAQRGERLAAEVAKFQAQYYARLIEGGIPAATAQELVLHEPFTANEFIPAVDAATIEPTPEAEPEKLDQPEPSVLQSMGKAGSSRVLGFPVLEVVPRFLLHVSLGLAVYLNARRLRAGARRVEFFGPAGWGLATLLGGILVAAVYWLMNPSTLAEKEEPTVIP